MNCNNILSVDELKHKVEIKIEKIKQNFCMKFWNLWNLTFIDLTFTKKYRYAREN